MKMKLGFCMLAIGAMSFLNSCSKDDGGADPTTPTGQNPTNPGTGNPTNPGNGSGTDYSQDVVSKSFTFTDVYFLSGSENSIKMDNKDASNPGLDRVPKLGKTLLLNSIGANPDTSMVVTVTGQIVPDNKKPIDMPNNDGFAYSAISIVSPQYVPEDSTAEPNIRIERIQDFTFAPNGAQGQDMFGNTIVNITSGEFKMTALVSGALGQTSSGQPVQSITYKYVSNAYVASYYADNAVVANSNLNVPNEIEALFNDNSASSIEVYGIEIINSDPNLNGLQVTRPYMPN